MTSFFPLFVLSRASDKATTLLLSILGGRMHGPSPTSNFGEPVPPVPARSPPLGVYIGLSQTVCHSHVYLTPDHVILKLSRYLDNSTSKNFPTHRNILFNIL